MVVKNLSAYLMQDPNTGKLTHVISVSPDYTAHTAWYQSSEVNSTAWAEKVDNWREALPADSVLRKPASQIRKALGIQGNYKSYEFDLNKFVNDLKSTNLLEATLSIEMYYSALMRNNHNPDIEAIVKVFKPLFEIIPQCRVDYLLMKFLGWEYIGVAFDRKNQEGLTAKVKERLTANDNVITEEAETDPTSGASGTKAEEAFTEHDEEDYNVPTEEAETDSTSGASGTEAEEAFTEHDKEDYNVPTEVAETDSTSGALETKVEEAFTEHDKEDDKIITEEAETDSTSGASGTKAEEAFTEHDKEDYNVPTEAASIKDTIKEFFRYCAEKMSTVSSLFLAPFGVMLHGDAVALGEEVAALGEAAAPAEGDLA